MISAIAVNLVAIALTDAATSPLLQWRDPIYIAGGFAGIIALGLLAVQPLMVSGRRVTRLQRRFHIWVGAGVLITVTIHIAGLWITSPADVVDVLVFRSPTPFGVWGAVATWAVLAAAVLGSIRKHMVPRSWRLAHATATLVAVVSTSAHELLLEGTLGNMSKIALCAITVVTLFWAFWRRRTWRLFR